MDEHMEALIFFEKMPGAFPLYEMIRGLICSEFDNVKVRVQKTQISFSNRYNFAFVSLPNRRIKGHPDVYIILTFGLGRRLEHPRVAIATEPYPGRWTHHIIIQGKDEIDDQIVAWLNEAYHFSMIK